jgi:hypothetical protein
MRIVIFILAITLAFSQGCKTKQRSETVNKTTQPVSVTPKTEGKVSHQYRSAGCATVILVKNGGETLTLIPKDDLSAGFDVDGMGITFDYRLLRMPNPKGCTVGIPAEITNISKK